MPETTFFSLKERGSQFDVVVLSISQLKENNNLLHQTRTKSPQDHAGSTCFLHDAVMGTELISDRLFNSKARRSCQTQTQQNKASSVTP